MNSKSKILFVNQGIIPYVPDSTMSRFGRKITQSMQESGHEIRTFLPQWGCINERRNQLHEVIRLSGMNIIIDGNDHPLIIKVASLQPTRMQVYFIDNDDYFDKRGMEGDKDGEEYDDNGERAIFYAHGVIGTAKKLRWHPDVVHCQGWISAIVPFYLKAAFKDEPTFSGSKIVFELNDIKLHKGLAANFAACLQARNVSKNLIKKEKINIEDPKELMKMGIRYSDAVIVSGAEADQELVDYAGSLGKKVLPYSENPDFAEYYGGFYDELAKESKG